MDAETIRWFTSIIVGNVLFGAAVMGMLRILLGRAKHTEDNTKALLLMHTGQRDSNRALVHYMRWFVEEMSGKTPPPYVNRDS